MSKVVNEEVLLQSSKPREDSKGQDDGSYFQGNEREIFKVTLAKSIHSLIAFDTDSPFFDML